MRKAKMLAYRLAQKSRVIPTVWMLRNPFKIYEFHEVVSPVELDPNHVILDLGCGKGFQTQVLARRCRTAIGLDVNERRIAEASRFLKHSYVEDRVRFICGRLETGQLSASSFDRVFSFCVLEHISNLREVLAEVARLLKQDGQLHASVDSLANIKDPTLLAQHRRDHRVVQYFTPQSLRDQVEAAGLKVIDVVPIMKGEFARRQFEQRIVKNEFSRPFWQRIRMYRRLYLEDRMTDKDEGVMLIVRARRP